MYICDTMLSTMKRKRRTPTGMMDDFRIYMNVLRSRGKTLQEIGKVINKDHSTVIYHLDVYESLKQIYPAFRKRIEEFNEEEFKQKAQQIGILNF